MSGAVTSPAVVGRPLAISVLLGLSGWVAGGFLLMFVAMLFRPDAPAEAAFTGLLLLGAAWGLFKVDEDGGQVFVTQFALALSIAGQCLVLYAMTKDARGIVPIAAAALLLQTVLLAVMPNRLHRTLSTFFALIAWAVTLRFSLLDEPGFWRARPDASPASLPVALLAWGLTWGPVAGLLWGLVRGRASGPGHPWGAALSSIVTGLIGGLAFATFASQPWALVLGLRDTQGGWGGLALWPLLSALAAVGALMAAFELRRRALMALCVVAALLHVGLFYHALGLSLLAKSLLMLVMGVVMLGAAHALRAKESA